MTDFRSLPLDADPFTLAADALVLTVLRWP